MDDRMCRICRRSEVDELISVRCQVASRKQTVGEMIGKVMGLRYSLTQFDLQYRMPGQLCDRCLARLDRAYGIWKRCRAASGLAQCDAGEEDRYFRCRICASGDAEELISVASVCTKWNVRIKGMVYELTKIRWRKGDGFPAFVCEECLKSLNLAYEFRREALGSARAFNGSTVDGCAWQKMEFRADKPDHLVVDLVSEARIGVRGVVYCSVCNVENSVERLEAMCSGCLLEFSNYNEITKNRKPVAEEGSEDIEDQMDWENSYDPVDGIEVDQKSIEEDLKEFVQFKQERTSDFSNAKKPSEKKFLIESRTEYDCCVSGCVWSGSHNELLWHLKHLHTDVAKDKAGNVLFCRFCQKLFPSLTKLNKHCAQKRAIFKCLFDNCSFTAKSMSEIMLHYKQHSSEEPSEKMLSEPVIIPANEAENYIKTEYVTENRCCVEDCNKFGTLKQMQSHFDIVHCDGMESISGSYKCRYCKQSFSNPNNSQAHFQRKVPLYKCIIDGCSLSSKNKTILLKHCTGLHEKVFLAKPIANWEPPRSARPDIKSFNIVGSVDEYTDILSRKNAWCCVCRRLFSSEKDLQIHRDSSHPVAESIFDDQPIFHCAQCNATFLDQTQLNEHVQKTSQQKHYYCRACEYLMWDERKLVQHRYLVHGKPSEEEDDEVGKLYVEEPIGPFRCCGCQLKFFSEAELIEHRQMQHENDEKIVAPSDQFQCAHCHAVFDKRRAFTEHRDKFRNLVYRCKIDGCSFRTEIRLTIKQHVSRFVEHNPLPQPAKVKLFQCCTDGCFFEDAIYWNVALHVYNQHQAVRNANQARFENPAFSCLACCMGFGTKSLRDSHVRRRRDQQQIPCDLCDRMMGGKIALAAHKIRFHGQAAKKPNEKAICNICGKQVSVYNMAAHLDVHNDVRRWMCTECPAAFNYKTLLQKHMRSHTLERPEACRYGCGKHYRQTADRNRHERLVHLNDQPLPYRCNECGASFIRDRDLRIHSRKHTGLKLYPCERCGDGFDRLRDFEAHQNVCTGQQYEEEYVTAD